MRYILISPTISFLSGTYLGLAKRMVRPTWAISPKCLVSLKKSEWIEANKASIKLIEKFLLENKVIYIDAVSILCPDIYCNNHDKDTLIYSDEQHLSSYGAMKLNKYIQTLIRPKS